MILVAENLHRFLPATESTSFSAVPSSSASCEPCASSASAQPLPQLVPMGDSLMRTTPRHLRIPPICINPPLAEMVDSPTFPRCAGPFSPDASEPSSPLPVSFGGFGSLHDEDMPDIPIPDLQGLDAAAASSVAGSVASTGDAASDCGSDSFSWGSSSAGSAASADSSETKAPPSSSSSTSSSHGATKGGYRPVHIIRSSNGVATPVRAPQSAPIAPPKRLVIPLAPTVPLASPTMLSPSVMSQFLASATTDRIVRLPSPAPASSAPCATIVSAGGEAFKQAAAPAADFVPAPLPVPATPTVTLQARQVVSGAVDVAAWASAAARAPQEQPHQVEMAAWRSLEDDIDTSPAAGGKAAGAWEVTGWFRQMAGWQAVNTVDSSEEQLLPGKEGPQTSFVWSKPQRTEVW